jgi:hypothetical protein
MAEEYTCIECEHLYDDRDGDTEERMCNKCLNYIYRYKVFTLELDIKNKENHWWAKLGKFLKII